MSIFRLNHRRIVLQLELDHSNQSAARRFAAFALLDARKAQSSLLRRVYGDISSVRGRLENTRFEIMSILVIGERSLYASDTMYCFGTIY